MNGIVKKFLEKVPKTDLHLHLDGSLRLPTLIELAKKENVELPSYTPEGLKETVFKERYADLSDYLKGFYYTCSVLNNAENLERVAYELAQDNISENVNYIEVRFAPQLHLNKQLPTIKKIIEAVTNGMKKAQEEHNNSKEVVSGGEIPFKFGFIVGAMRSFNKHMSPYYAGLLGSLPFASKKQVFKLASLDLARASVELRDKHDFPIVGFDLCGEEAGYPAVDHHESYRYVHNNFMEKTVHAGEAYGPESIFQAITKCHANRIGHGTFLFNHKMIKDPKIKNPKKFSYHLAQYIAKRRIAIEVCPTSNLQTIPELKTIKNHPVKQMIENKMSVTVCTDNRLVSNTTVTRELGLLIDNIPVSKKELRDIIIAGFKGCFYHGSYKEHRAFVRTVFNKYFSLEEKILGNSEDNDLL